MFIINQASTSFKRNVLGCLFFLFIFIGQTLLFAQWKEAAPMPEGRSGFAIARLDNYVYIIGGNNSENEATSSVLRYNLDADLWDTSVAPLHKGRTNAAVVVANHSIFVMGGRNENSSLNSVEKYSPGQNKWVELESLQHEREAASAAILNGKIYVFGGKNQENPNYPTAEKSIEIYDFSSGHWSMLHNHNMSYPRFGARAIVAHSKIYILGGFYFSPVSLVESFRPDFGWQEVHSLAIPRALFATAVMNDTIYIMGGQGIYGILDQNETFVVNDQRGPSENPPPLTPPRYDFSGIAYQNRVYIFGGVSAENESPLNLVQYWEPVVSAVHKFSATKPERFTVFPNYPNPFSNTTTIQFSIKENFGQKHPAVIQIFNMLGQKVRALVPVASQPGFYTAQWNGRDEDGQLLPNGIYMCRIGGNGHISQQKLILVR